MPKAEKSPPFTIEPGALLAGKYRAVRTLATGGMGMVVLVKHEVLGQKAAIKVLRPDALAGRDAAERFLREARASANLKSDHVVRVFDVGSLDDGAPYMLMEYLEGRDLAEEVRRRGKLPADEAVDYVLQAIDAVAEAHAIGVVHRDLKPSNLFVVTRADGVRFVKVLDFGISKLVAGVGEISDGAVTTADALLGSPAYMSPEQVKSSKDVDGRTDVWSLGVVLYELISGARAFEGDTVGGILSQILCEDVTPIATIVLDLPRGLDVVIGRCLERSRDLRYDTVLALRDALMPYASERARRTLPSRASMPPAAPELSNARTPRRAMAEETTIDVSSERVGVQSTVAVSSERRARDSQDRSRDRVTPSIAPPADARPRSHGPMRAIAGGAAACFVVVMIWLVARSSGAPVGAAGTSVPTAVLTPPAVVVSSVPAPSATIAPDVATSAAASASASNSAAAPLPGAPPPKRVSTPRAAGTMAETAKPPAGPAKQPSIDLDQRN